MRKTYAFFAPKQQQQDSYEIRHTYVRHDNDRKARSNWKKDWARKPNTLSKRNFRYSLEVKASNHNYILSTFIRKFERICLEVTNFLLLLLQA
jgi:hypothetical protein